MFDGFIQNVFSKNVVEVDMDIHAAFNKYDDYCLCIPHNESLKVFKVSTEYRLKFPAFPDCFPSLRVFHAEVAVDERNEWITNVFPCVHALEDLHLVADIKHRSGRFNFNIGGPALTHLIFKIRSTKGGDCDAMVVIDAPKLELLALEDAFLASYIVKHKPAISDVFLEVGIEAKLLQVGPTLLTRFDDLLHGLVNTKSITVKVVFPQNWNLPVLPYVTKLKLFLPGCNLILLLHWLQSCPNLEALDVIIMEYPPYEFEVVMPDVMPLPSCLSSCLKEIKISRNKGGDYEKMLFYLLYNAKVLDSFIVDFRVYIKDGISHYLG